MEYPCDTANNPDTTITWYYNGAVIQSGSEEVVVSGNGSLTIPAPQVNHSGVYQCVAANRYGEDWRAWILEVREPTSKLFRWMVYFELLANDIYRYCD